MIARPLWIERIEAAWKEAPIAWLSGMRRVGKATLAASKKFRDTLTGRKRQIHLTPVLAVELEAFGVKLPKRLLHGGLPPALLAEAKKHSFYREWMDSFFARDIQRLFGFREGRKVQLDWQ